MTCKQLIMSFFIGISGGCYAMHPTPHHVALREIVLNGAYQFSELHHDDAVLTDGQLIELAHVITSDNHYQNLCGYAMQLLNAQKDCLQALRVLSRASLQRYGAPVSLHNLVARRHMPMRYAWRVQEALQSVFFVYVLTPSSPMIVVFSSQGQRVGALEWTHNENGYHIDLLAVDPCYRKRGIATALMVLALQFFTRDNQSEPCVITLDAVAGDPCAVNQERLVDFYQSCGFKFLDNNTGSQCRMILWIS